MSKKIFYFTLLFLLCTVVSACGQSGKLYLPSDTEAAKKLAPQND